MLVKHIYTEKFTREDGKVFFYSNCGKLVSVKEVVDTSVASKTVTCTKCLR
jgi:hypothetical protein